MRISVSSFTAEVVADRAEEAVRERNAGTKAWYRVGTGALLEADASRARSTLRLEGAVEKTACTRQTLDSTHPRLG
jgi:hypothetical protein